MQTKIKMFINESVKNFFKNSNFSIFENNSKLNIPFGLKIKNFSIYKEAHELKKIKQLTFITRKRGRKLKKETLENTCDNSEIYFENKVHNRFSSDNVKRRIKALFHKYIINLLNYLIKKRFTEIKMEFVYINSKLTKDISIEFNRSLLNQKIKDIIVNISKKYNDKDHNKKCIKYIESQNDNEEIIKILNMTYKDLYEQFYLNSNENNSSNNSFVEHKKKLMNLYGKEYLKIFSENAENLMEFFLKGKNRKQRKYKEIKVIDISNDGDSSENTTEINNIKNFEKLFNKNNMVSIGTQTDLGNINSKLISFV